jgi:uncharacterized LabA/DUF88 family protein
LAPRFPLEIGGFFSSDRGLAMPRIVALVDGFNLYHSIAENPAFHKFKWLNIDKLLRTYFPLGLEKILYFTAPTPWDADKVARHKILIRALESTRIEVVYGKFKERDRTCPRCKQTYKAREEKQTDVGIALMLFRMAYEKKFEQAVLLTGDSDQLPSFREVHRSFPGLRLGVLLPIGREAAELKTESDFYIRIRARVLANCLFDDPLKLADGTILNCPIEWK